MLKEMGCQNVVMVLAVAVTGELAELPGSDWLVPQQTGCQPQGPEVPDAPAVAR
jgi:hypothetical protein